MVNISVSLLNGYNWGYAPFSDIPIYSRCMSRRRLYELRYRLRIDIWKTSNLGRLVSLFSHLRNEKLPSDNVCVCANFLHYLQFPCQVGFWYPHCINCLFDLPIISAARPHPHPKSIPILQSVPSTANRTQVQLDWTAPSTEDLDLCVRGINLAGEEVAQMRLSKEDRPGSRERRDRGI